MPPEPLAELPLFDRVRSTCRSVASAAQLVRIDHDVLAAFADGFPVVDARRAAADDRIVSATPDSDEATAALTLAVAAVSFTSGWHDIMRKRPGMSGAVSTIARLVDYEAATGPFTADRLLAVTATDASQIFEQDIGSNTAGGALEDLVDRLATTLRELGTLAGDHGSFTALITSADGSAESLATTLGTMSTFHDVADYTPSDGPPFTVWFYKRAQMAVASLHRAFEGDGLGRFDDIDRLTIFADNLLPHVLRVDGVLHYDTELAAAIEAGELLPAGSAAEVEIRACGLHATELIAERLRERGEAITLADVDHALWSKGGGPTYKAVPRHRCRNNFY